jgi:hypothetical protein
MTANRVLGLCTHPTIHLRRLELGKQLVHREGLIFLGLKNGLDLLTSHGTIQGMQELDSPVMVIVQEHNNISPHVVHDHHESLEHGIYGLTGEMCEILVLSPVGRKEPSLNLSFLGMSILKLLANPTRQVLCVNLIEFRLTQSMVQVVNRLVVGVEHVPRSWSKEVNMMNISCIHRDIPQDPTLTTEESSHPSLPHLVVLTIKVWRTPTPFLVFHFWILDWLESRRSVTGSDTN